MPVAVNGSVRPAATDELPGVTTIANSVGELVKVTPGLETPASDAEITLVPTATVVARPAESIVATDGVADAQFTELVTSRRAIGVGARGGEPLREAHADRRIAGSDGDRRQGRTAIIPKEARSGTSWLPLGVPSPVTRS